MKMKKDLITKTEYEGARAILHHSIKETELKKAQETIKEYKKQQAERNEKKESLI